MEWLNGIPQWYDENQASIAYMIGLIPGTAALVNGSERVRWALWWVLFLLCVGLTVGLCLLKWNLFKGDGQPAKIDEDKLSDEMKKILHNIAHADFKDASADLILEYGNMEVADCVVSVWLTRNSIGLGHEAKMKHQVNLNWDDQYRVRAAFNARVTQLKAERENYILMAAAEGKPAKKA